MNRSSFAIFLTFFAASWLSNDWIIRTTGKLVQSSTLETVLAVSSLSGIVFFIFLKSLTFFQKPMIAAITMLPLWGALVFTHEYFPGSPVLSTLIALLLGETMKWHAYSQVLNRYGPFTAGKIIGFSVLAYELGTMTSSVTAPLKNTPVLLGLNLAAMILIHLPFFMATKSDERTAAVPSEPQTQSSTNLLGWILLLGAAAGFLKVSADTGFKYAIRQNSDDPTGMIAQFYLLSSVITIALWFIKRQRWMAARLERPEVTLSGLAIVQCLFGIALLTGTLPLLTISSALQRSFDKIFYQPTIQLLASGFSLFTQEKLRRFHSSAFLGLGSLLGLLAFVSYGSVMSADSLLKGISSLHLVVAFGFAFVSAVFIKKLISALDEESSDTKTSSGSRAMAMLALLSPQHFLVHALIWSKKRGGLHTLPQEILQELSSSSSESHTLRSFYLIFPKIDETHQLAIVKLSIFLDRKSDRNFLFDLTQEKMNCTRKIRKVAALHLIKVDPDFYRPQLKSSRMAKSSKKAA